MNEIKYKGIETCSTCIGESTEWILTEIPMLKMVKFNEKNNPLSNALIFSSIKDNSFFMYEKNGKIFIVYEEDKIESSRFEKINVNKSKDKIIFKSEERTIEFTRI
mgnify:CR=1 FL=1